jgi:hypothetical protein
VEKAAEEESVQASDEEVGSRSTRRKAAKIVISDDQEQ